ncbi:MAG: hypothetical protein EZS28_051609, partial [Streblomastix strix]
MIAPPDEPLPILNPFYIGTGRAPNIPAQNAFQSLLPPFYEIRGLSRYKQYQIELEIQNREKKNKKRWVSSIYRTDAYSFIGVDKGEQDFDTRSRSNQDEGQLVADQVKDHNQKENIKDRSYFGYTQNAQTGQMNIERSSFKRKDNHPTLSQIQLTQSQGIGSIPNSPSAVSASSALQYSYSQQIKSPQAQNVMISPAARPPIIQHQNSGPIYTNASAVPTNAQQQSMIQHGKTSPKQTILTSPKQSNLQPEEIMSARSSMNIGQQDQ